MAQNDIISDILARMRNAQMAGHPTVVVPSSKAVRNVLDVFCREGYIAGYELMPIRKAVDNLVVTLKYYEGEPVIKKLKRISTPGVRRYTSVKDMPKVFNGLGISVLSTPKGVLSDEEARMQHVGGEIICTVF